MFHKNDITQKLTHMEQQSIKNTSSSSMSHSWVRVTCIGRGSFGAVNKAVNKSDNTVFAVKSVDLATCLPTQTESLENEISVLRSIKPHNNIIQFLGDSFSKEQTTTFRNLHLEYLPEGDVANHNIDETLLQRYTACLVYALRHVHSQGYVHCDVKARNVLVSQSFGVKLADFGSAIRAGESTALIAPRGSPLWMAPEVVRREYQGPESDVWSLGCTVIEMVTGKPAWEDMGIDTLTRIGFSDKLPVFPVMSENGRDFLDKCLKRDRSQRWSCDQLLKHPFLSDCRDLCRAESSPRCVLDWVDSGFELEEEEEVERNEWRRELESAAMTRMSKLVTMGGANWEPDGWVEVRNHASEAERVTLEYSESAWVDSYSDVEDDSTTVNDPSLNRRSAVPLSYELVIVIFLLIKVVVGSTNFSSASILIINWCYRYHCDNNKELEIMTLIRVKLVVGLPFRLYTCDSDRTKNVVIRVS